MLKKLLLLSMISLCSSGAYAEEAISTIESPEVAETTDKKLAFDYQDLQLGDVRHIKIIKDQSLLIPNSDPAEANNSKIMSNTLAKLSSYKVTLKDTAPSDTAVIENIEKIEKILQQIDLTNILYSENKNAQLIDTDQEEFKNECFYKKYSSLKICFEYGFGKIISIKKIEKKDSSKIAEKEEDAIVEKLKAAGYKKDDGFFVKDGKKFSIETKDNVIETVTTTEKLEEFRKTTAKDLKEKNFKTSIAEHLEFLK